MYMKGFACKSNHCPVNLTIFTDSSLFQGSVSKDNLVVISLQDLSVHEKGYCSLRNGKRIMTPPYKFFLLLFTLFKGETYPVFIRLFWILWRWKFKHATFVLYRVLIYKRSYVTEKVSVLKYESLWTYICEFYVKKILENICKMFLLWIFISSGKTSNKVEHALF